MGVLHSSVIINILVLVLPFLRDKFPETKHENAMAKDMSMLEW